MNKKYPENYLKAFGTKNIILTNFNSFHPRMLWANFDLNVAQWFVRRSGKSKKFVEGRWTTKFA